MSIAQDAGGLQASDRLSGGVWNGTQVGAVGRRLPDHRGGRPVLRPVAVLPLRADEGGPAALYQGGRGPARSPAGAAAVLGGAPGSRRPPGRDGEGGLRCRTSTFVGCGPSWRFTDRKSTRLNSSHVKI